MYCNIFGLKISKIKYQHPLLAKLIIISYAKKPLAYVHTQHKESYDDDDVILINAQYNTG